MLAGDMGKGSALTAVASVERVARPQTVRCADYRVAGGKPVDLASLPTRSALAEHAKDTLRTVLRRQVERFAELQGRLYAERRRALLVVFQGLDAAGKDSTIKHVTSGVNPQGFRVTNFARPDVKELEHTWLHRHYLALPERGRIGIFNRSHYEEAVTLRVHPELLAGRPLPPGKVNGAFWTARLRDIVAFERHLAANGTTVVKFFLHVSKKEQKRRLLERLEDPAKNWKFDPADLVARRRWRDYHQAYAAAFTATSTDRSPWYVIPADSKPAMRVIVAAIIVETLAALDPRFPQPTAALRKAIASARETLRREDA